MECHIGSKGKPRAHLPALHPAAQGGATGRLLVYAPATGEATVLAGGLWYANGVAVAPDESFVAVVETCSMRVRRYWLKGEKASGGLWAPAGWAALSWWLYGSARPGASGSV